MHSFSGLLGIVVILGIAIFFSVNRKKIDTKIILWGLSLQFFFSLIILKVPFIKNQFLYVDLFFKKLISFSNAGSNFLFESFVTGIGYHSALVNFAFRALPVIIFFSSLVSMLYHLGLTQMIIRFILKLCKKQ